MPFSYRDENRELNERTRKEASGAFIQLSDGFTHYELSNPEAQQTVVLVHGFSVPSFIFDPTFEFLTRAGLRVLRYDLFGRGFSDKPDVRYGVDLFVRQLDDLLQRLQLPGAVSLAGLSTGGPITAAFTTRFPARVDKLVLIGPVGAKPLPVARLLRLATLPLIGEALAGLVRSDRLDNQIVSRLFDREFIEHFRAKYVVQMQFKGFRGAILSTLRNKMLDPCLEVYEQIDKMGKPVLLFWGREDPTVPFEHSTVLRAAMPHIRFHAFDNCGHIPHYEKPDEANPILLEFLRK